MQGTYKITNKITGKIYVGSSMNLQLRFAQHKNRLSNGTHRVKDFIEDWNKFGEDNFTFEFTEFKNLTRKELFMEEQKELDIAKLTPDLFYNKAFDIIGWQKYSNRSGLTSPTKGKLLKSNLKDKFDFLNISTNEIFSGTRRDMYKKLNAHRTHINRLIKGDLKSFRGWVIKDRLDENPNLLESARVENYPEGTFSFKHKKTNEIFIGSCYEFRIKYGVRKYKIENMVFNKKVGDGWKCQEI